MTGPEQTKLLDRLFSDPTRRTHNFKFTPGDNPVCAEKLCQQINFVLDEVERRRAAGIPHDGPVKTGKPRVNIRDLVSTL